MSAYRYPAYPPPVVVAQPPRLPARTFHLVMIIATCGGWVPIWFACEVISASRRSSYYRRLRAQQQWAAYSYVPPSGQPYDYYS